MRCLLATASRWFFCLIGIIGIYVSPGICLGAAPAYPPYIRNFSKHDYQALNQNWSVCQHPSTGFVYVANSKGLLEYDGTHWRTYRLPDRQIVRSVAVDGQGRIFTGGLGEFGYWSPDSSGSLGYHSLNRLIKTSRFRKEEIWNIVTGPDFVFFQSFSTAFLYQRGQIRELSLPGNILFLFRVGDRFLLQAIGQGLYELAGGRFQPLSGTESLSRTAVHTILPFGTSDLLIGTQAHGLFVYQQGSLTPWITPASAFLQKYQCNKGIRLPDGQYALGTILNGLIVTDWTGAIHTHLSRKEGMQNNTILALALDAQGHLWTGLDDGLDVVAFHYPLAYFSDANGQLGTPYDAVLHQQKLFLGTNHGVFWCDYPIIGTPVYHLIEGSQGQVWKLTVLNGDLLCGHNMGTYRITPSLTWEPVSNMAGGRALLPLKDRPDLAVQGTYTGLCLYKFEKEKWELCHRLQGLSEPIREVWQDSDGQLWLQHAHRGLYCARLADDQSRLTNIRFVHHFREFPREVDFSAFLHRYPAAVVTRQALLSYGSVKTRGQSRQAYALPDSIRRLFRGIFGEYLFLRHDGRLLLSRPNTSLIEIPISRFAWMEDYENVVPLDSAHYLLCFEEGFALLPRSQFDLMNRWQHTSTPLIRQLTIRTEKDQKVYTFQRPADVTAFFASLSARENQVQFTFSQPGAIQSTRFSFRLQGLDDRWSDAAQSTSKEYTKLQPGSYAFQLRSGDSGPISTLRFEILPPWYQSPWAMFGYVLLGSGLVVTGWQIHRRQLQKQQIRIHQQMEAKLRQEQELHRQQLVQLQKEKLELDVIAKSEELANTTMNLIQKNELLSRLKSEVESLKEEVQQRQALGQATGHINQVIKLIDASLTSRQDWKVFEKNFNKVHERFFKRLLEQYDSLTTSDLRLAAYLRMNLSSKEIAKLMNITVRSVELKRYRLRKRLGLPPNANLNEFMIEY